MNQLSGFQELGVSETLLSALEAKGFREPTSIQKLAIPLLLSGEKDLIGQALTGTGKTAAFGIPVIQELTAAPCSRSAKAPGALILSPTRELSIQIAEEINSLQAGKKLHIGCFYGGQPIQIQLTALKKGIDIAVGTPGRIMDLHRRGALDLTQLRFAVLDEADEMLDMGFVDDITEILSLTNADKRMLMFSATMPPEIMTIAGNFMRPDYEIARASQEATNPELTEQIYYEVKRETKIDALCRLIEAIPDLYALVFCRTRADVDEVTEKLNSKKYSVEALHGEISQAQRLRVIEAFKKRKFPLLIATDVAARGIDVNDLTHVINFSLPQNQETYIHRIGRTGRAGKHGTAISFVTPREFRKFKSIQQGIGVEIVKKQLPDLADIVEAKKNALAEKLSDFVADEKNNSVYLDFAEQLCTLADHPAQVISALLKLHFGDKLLRPPAPPEAEEMKKLLLFAGRNEGLTLPVLLREIYERTGIRGGALGKIVCRADKTFIDAAGADADKILRAFKNDPEFRFKLDDGRPMKRSNRKKDIPQENDTKLRTEKKKKQNSKSERKAEKNSAPVRKPLREQFWSLIGDPE